jgi:hypothetical protein
MHESKLTNFQQRALSDSMKQGTSLPTNVGATTRISEKKRAVVRQPESKLVNPATYKYGLRKYDEIKNSGAFERPEYRPAYKSVD